MKVISIRIITALMFILQASSFPAETVEGFDMGLYSLGAGYLFFIALLILFSLLLYFTSHPQNTEPERVKEVVINQAAVKVLDRKVYKTLDLLFYAVAAILILNAVIFIAMIFD